MEEFIILSNIIKQKEEEIIKLKNTIIYNNNEIQKLKDEINKNINNDSNDLILFSLYLIILTLIYSII
jgi:hypothetical protein